MNISVILSLVDRLSGPLRAVRERLNAIMNSRIGRALGGVGMAMGGVADEAGRLAAKLGMLGAVGGFALKGFVDTASSYEKMLTTLETTEGSVEKAKKAMEWASDFATTTPYEISEVTEAFIKLRAYGMDPTQGLLRTLGDTASAMGKDVMQAVEAIADAVTGENERLKEFGIKASKAGGQITYSYTDAAGDQKFKTVDGENRALIQSTLEAIWNEKYAGAMDRQSKTWAGMISNLSDHWERFQLTVMEAGLFEWMKGKLGGALERLNAMAASGELKDLATVIGTRLKEGAIVAWSALQQLIGKLREGWALLLRVRDAVGGWRPIMIAVAAVIAGPLLVSLGMLVLMVANLALALGPVGWGVMAVIAIWARFGPQIMEAIGPAIDYIKRIPGAVADVALAITPTIVAIIDYFKRIPSAVADLAIEIVAAFNGLPDKLMSIGRNIIDGLLAGMKEKWIALKEWTIGLAIEIVAAFNGLPDKLMSIGRNIIDGLLAGMKEKWIALKEWTSGLADMLPEWVRKPLKVQSPSRVFMEIGGNLVKGLEVGIAARERMPALAMRSVAGGAMMAGALAMPPALATTPTTTPVSIAAAVGGRAGGAGPISMPITITITAPAGADAQQLAALVRTQVEQATRDAGRRLSGALYDSPDNM